LTVGNENFMVGNENLTQGDLILGLRLQISI
jgi:hypothetical protein